MKSTQVPTFEEFVSRPERSYYGARCDLKIIPKRFADRINRLVRIYNTLLEQDQLGVEKLERVVGLSNKVVYSSWN